MSPSGRVYIFLDADFYNRSQMRNLLRHYVVSIVSQDSKYNTGSYASIFFLNISKYSGDDFALAF